MCCECCSVLSGSVEASLGGPKSTLAGDNGKAAKGSLLTQRDWDANKAFIWDLYISKGATLKEVQGTLSLRGFVATEKMFKSRLESWGFVKNALRKDWLGAALLWNTQEAAGLPLDDILIHGKIKTPADKKRYLHAEFLEEALQKKVAIPSYVRFVTPGDVQKPLDEALHDLAPSSKITGEVESQFSGSFHSPCGSCDGINNQFAPAHQDEGPSLAAVPSVSCEKLLFEPPYHLEPFSRPPLNAQLGYTMQNTYDMADFLFQMGQSDTGNSIVDLEIPDHSLYRARKKWKFDGAAGEIAHGTHEKQSAIRIYDLVPIPMANMESQPWTHASGSQLNTETLERNENEAATFLAACICFPICGALGKNDVLEFGLQKVAESFHAICRSVNPMLLLTINTIMVLLRVHAEGSLPESLLRAIHHAAIGALSARDPICRCVEWMMAAAGGNACDHAIDSNALQDVCHSISQVYGKKHNHSLVAAYCLSFQLLFERAYAEAEAQLSFSYNTAVEVLGPDALLTVNILTALSRAQTRQGRHQAALDTIDECLERTPLGTPLRLNHPHRFELLYRKALICKQLGRIDEMLEYFCTIVEGRAAALGTAHSSTQKAHQGLENALREHDMWESHKDVAHRLLHSPQVDLTEGEEL